jgi:hypothetical protein
MMTHHSLIVRSVVAGAVLLSACAGCQATKKVTGTHYTHFSADPDQVVAAAEQALAELELQTISSSASKLDGWIEARTAQGKKVAIKVKQEAEGVSEVSIKVGTLGDRTISEAIFEKTRVQLEK